MAKKRRRKFPKTPVQPMGRTPRPQVPDELLHFSFKYFQPNHTLSQNVAFGNEYAKKLLAQFKELERYTIGFFCKSAPESLCVHRISWNDPKVAENGFGIHNGNEFDDEAWQFAITGNKHGRVHGFLFDNTFQVVWLDPNHNLYA